MLSALYDAALLLGLAVSSPWWLLRMATTGRYRHGLRERLGRVPARLRTAVAGRRVVWVHAVSVGEVLAVSRLVAELAARLNVGAAPGDSAPWQVVVSTTTQTGQRLARERFGADRVFFFPLDLRWAVRAWLRALRPALIVLAESEVWPGLLGACGRAGVPVAVVNARVSDRSFRRGLRVRRVWGRVLARVTLFLAQSEEDGRRLLALGARAGTVQVAGNLKYDVRAPGASAMAERLRTAAAGRPVIVAGSTADGEEALLLGALRGVWETVPDALLVLAPRHPERFDLVEGLAAEFGAVRATQLGAQAAGSSDGGAGASGTRLPPTTRVVVLDTIGDLASVYGLAVAAFVGGSLVPRGGHSPLEPAQFGVTVVMGRSFENFRGAVDALRAADALALVGEGIGRAFRAGHPVSERVTAPAKHREGAGQPEASLASELEATLLHLLGDPDAARAMGARGRAVFLAQGGATTRTVDALLPLLGGALRASSASPVAIPQAPAAAGVRA